MKKKFIIIVLAVIIPLLLFAQVRLTDEGDSNSGRNESNNNFSGKRIRLAIPAVYGKVSDFVNGFAHVCPNKPTIFFLNSHRAIKYYIKNKMYKVIIDKRGRRINNGKYYSVTDFSNHGYASVRNIALKGHNKSAIINRYGKIFFPFKYPFYHKIYKRTVPVIFKNNFCGFMRRYGNRFKVIMGPKYASVQEFSEGLIVVQPYINVYTSKVGYADINGRLVIPAKYDMAGEFSEGLAAVRVKGDRLYGYINKRGKMVIRPQFIDAEKFHQGRARVIGGRYGGRTGYINKSGKIVIPIIYRDGTIFSEGYAAVKKNGRYYFINRSGRIVINRNGYLHAGTFKEGLAFAKHSNGLYGFINKQGEWVIPPQFEEARSFSDGMAAVKVNGKWGFIARP